jgi:hypothetical protein
VKIWVAPTAGLISQSDRLLVNYDLPWNPMIVEQRIGRIQRLASTHKSVGIFNIMLKGTFEETIVGRLMEKLQMASHAIGDLESLLEASGVNGGDEGSTSSFAEKICQLVLMALAGKNVEEATSQTEKSIADAKATLEREEAHINALLGGMDGAEDSGPRAPSLPVPVRSMDPQTFTLGALRCLGTNVTQKAADLFQVDAKGKIEYIRFGAIDESCVRSIMYAPGTPAFLRLVGRVTATGVYDIEDQDREPLKICEKIAGRWVREMEGIFHGIELDRVRRCFEGTAVVRVRATVAHDSYERLVEVVCSSDEHNSEVGRPGLSPLSPTMENPVAVGLNIENVAEIAELDASISEFSRFYLERRAQEMKAAGDDVRKQKKLEDDFTPRLEMSIVALEGKVHRQIQAKVLYRFDDTHIYTSNLAVVPHSGELIGTPESATCGLSGRLVPATCLEKCQISGVSGLRHLMAQSEVSSRFAVPPLTVLCSMSGYWVLKDEVEVSAMSGRMVTCSLLETSAVSGKRAEPVYFGRCEVSHVSALNDELAISELSGKRYRTDQQGRSAVSGKTGHKVEFVTCRETGLFVSISETEQCEVTGSLVRRGILQECAVSRKRVLPSELWLCAWTGKRALKNLMATSSVSGLDILMEVATRSATGVYCSPLETRPCRWSGKQYHPVDLRLCELTGVDVHFEFTRSSGGFLLRDLAELLDGTSRKADATLRWEDIAVKTRAVFPSRGCKVEAAIISPDGRHLAACVEMKDWFGWRVRQAGVLLATDDYSIVGRVTQGQRSSSGWFPSQ